MNVKASTVTPNTTCTLCGENQAQGGVCPRHTLRVLTPTALRSLCSLSQGLFSSLTLPHPLCLEPPSNPLASSLFLGHAHSLSWEALGSPVSLPTLCRGCIPRHLQTSPLTSLGPLLKSYPKAFCGHWTCNFIPGCFLLYLSPFLWIFFIALVLI